MSNAQKTAGVLGGMGPEATVDFMARVIAHTDADRDQDHVRMLVDHNPHVPNRQDAILAATHIPLISIIGVSIAAATERAPQATRIGVLATDGCIKSGIYQAGLEEAGLEAELPTAEELGELMTLIKAIKAGKHTEETARGMAELAGCTEIPLVLDADAVSVPLVSSTDALAEITVKLATGEIPLPDCL